MVYMYIIYGVYDYVYTARNPMSNSLLRILCAPAHQPLAWTVHPSLPLHMYYFISNGEWR